MKRIAIDNMIVDLIMDTPGLLASIRKAAERGALVIVTTHILRDQLDATRDEGRRERLLAVYDALPKENVATRGNVLGISRFGAATFGDGAESGVSLDQVKTAGRGAWQDALIATTASGDADVLVTGDKTLAKKVKAAGAKCAIWNFEDLVRFVQTEGA